MNKQLGISVLKAIQLITEENGDYGIDYHTVTTVSNRYRFAGLKMEKGQNELVTITINLKRPMTKKEDDWIWNEDLNSV